MNFDNISAGSLRVVGKLVRDEDEAGEARTRVLTFRWMPEARWKLRPDR